MPVKKQTISEGNITLPKNAKDMTYGEFLFLSQYIKYLNKWVVDGGKKIEEPK